MIDVDHQKWIENSDTMICTPKKKKKKIKKKKKKKEVNNKWQKWSIKYISIFKLAYQQNFYRLQVKTLKWYLNYLYRPCACCLTCLMGEILVRCLIAELQQLYGNRARHVAWLVIIELFADLNF